MAREETDNFGWLDEACGDEGSDPTASGRLQLTRAVNEMVAASEAMHDSNWGCLLVCLCV